MSFVLYPFADALPGLPEAARLAGIAHALLLLPAVLVLRDLAGLHRSPLASGVAGFGAAALLSTAAAPAMALVGMPGHLTVQVAAPAFGAMGVWLAASVVLAGGRHGHGLGLGHGPGSEPEVLPRGVVVFGTLAGAGLALSAAATLTGRISGIQEAGLVGLGSAVLVMLAYPVWAWRFARHLRADEPAPPPHETTEPGPARSASQRPGAGKG